MFRVKEIWSTTGCTEDRRVIGGFHWLGRKKNRTNRNTNKKKKQKLQYVACKKYRAQLGGWRRGGRLEDGRGLSAGGCSWWVGGCREVEMVNKPVEDLDHLRSCGRPRQERTNYSAKNAPRWVLWVRGWVLRNKPVQDLDRSHWDPRLMWVVGGQE